MSPQTPNQNQEPTYRDGVIIYNDISAKTTCVAFYGQFPRAEFENALAHLKEDKNLRLILSRYNLTPEQSKEVMESIGSAPAPELAEKVRGLLKILLQN